VAIGSTSGQGTWNIVHDSGSPAKPWGNVVFNLEPQGAIPPGTALGVEVRSSDTVAGLSSQSYMPAGNGVNFMAVGRYLEVRARLATSTSGESPVLSDLHINAKRCHVDGDSDVDLDDINLITAARNTPPANPGDPRDFDRNGIINVLDASQCRLQCTRPNCAR